MSTILVNNITPYTGETVTISGSNILVTGNTTLGDNSGVDTITVNGHITASGNISASSLNISGDATINGNLTFGNSTSDSVTFGAEISSSLIPDLDNIFDLGSNGKQWKDLYIDGTANIDSGSINHIHGVNNNDSRISVSSSLIPTNDDAFDLGSSTKQWKDLYIDGTANIDTGNIDTGNITTANITIANVSQIISGSSLILANSASITGHVSASSFSAVAGTGSFGKIVGTLLTAAQPNITSVGTLGAAVWNGSVIESVYLDADTAHLTTNQTFSGNKNFSSTITASADISSSGEIIGLTGSFGMIQSEQLVSHTGDNNTGLQFASDTVIIESNDVQIGKFTSTYINLNTPISNGLTSAGIVIDDNLKISSSLTASADISSSGTLIANEANIIGNITASADISSSGTVTAAILVGAHTLTTAAQPNITSLGVLTGLEVADGASISGSNLKLEGSASVVGHVSASSFAAVAGTGSFGKIVGTLLTAAQPNVTAVGTIGTGVWNGTAIASAFLDADTAHLTTNQTFSGNKIFSGTTAINGGLTLGGTAAAAALDANNYSINAKRGEVRSLLQAAVAVDTGWVLELRNTSIAADSLIVANVIGGDGAIVTGSVVSANVVAASTSSLNFYNVGAAILDNAAFTASFAIL